MSRFLTLRLSALLLIALSVLFTLSACGGQEEGEYVIGDPLTDSTLAAVVVSDFGEDTLTVTTFNMALSQLMQQQAPLIDRLEGQEQQEQRDLIRRQLVEQFVMSHLVQGKIEQLGIEPEVDSAAVTQQVMRQMSMMRSLDDYEAMLEQRNLTEATLSRMLRQRIRAQMVAQSQQQMLLDSLTQDVEPPEPAVLDTFIQNRRDEEIRARHILYALPADASDSRKDSVRSVAATVLDSALAGSDFAELARRHSEGPAGARGGDLGYFSRRDMVPPFEEAAFAIQDTGEVYQDLVETRYGFHIIRLEGRRLAPPVDSAQATQILMQQRRREAIEDAIDRLRSQATVRLNNEVVQTELNVPEEEEDLVDGGL